jgi:hypothetical protein
LTKELTFRLLWINKPIFQDAPVSPREIEGCGSIDRHAPAQVEQRQHRGKLVGKVRVHRRRLPQEAVLGESLDVVGYDATLAKGIDEGDAIAAAVIANKIAIGGDDRAQIVAEFDVDGRAIVERPDAHVEDMLRSLRCFACETVREIE